MNSSYFNTGIYTVRDAARLTSVSTGRIRRWLRGYRYRSRKKAYASPPLWQGQWKPIDHSLALGFLDLIEIRFVDAFLKAGVSWTILRQARMRSGETFQASHPFCTNRFVTDGREIFVELHRETGEPSLLDIVRRQHVFAQIIKPFLIELEFAQGSGLVRWWPLGEKRLVVLDPTRNFGRPIVARHGVPTEVLASAAKAAGSVAEVVRWYEVPEQEIADAVEFEQRLAA
ncbi:MAG: hypothetical protein HY735_23895 [Verrucomicrobia bacterium]|nr:hypothetical protein [Verrucomicrobiota bacterium]